MWQDLLLFWTLLHWLWFGSRLLNGAGALLRLSHRHNDRTGATLLLRFHIELLLLLLFVWVIERWIRIINSFKLASLVTLLIKSRWLHIELLLKITLRIFNISAFNIVFFNQLYLLLQHIFATMYYFQLVFVLTFMILPHVDLRFFLGVGILYHLIEYCGSSFFLIIICLHGSKVGILLHNLCTIGPQGIFVTWWILNLVLLNLSVASFQLLFLWVCRKVLLWHCIFKF